MEPTVKNPAKDIRYSFVLLQDIKKLLGGKRTITLTPRFLRTVAKGSPIEVKLNKRKKQNQNESRKKARQEKEKHDSPPAAPTFVLPIVPIEITNSTFETLDVDLDLSSALSGMGASQEMQAPVPVDISLNPLKGPIDLEVTLPAIEYCEVSDNLPLPEFMEEDDTEVTELIDLTVDDDVGMSETPRKEGDMDIDDTQTSAPLLTTDTSQFDRELSGPESFTLNEFDQSLGIQEVEISSEATSTLEDLEERMNSVDLTDKTKELSPCSSFVVSPCKSYRSEVVSPSPSFSNFSSTGSSSSSQDDCQSNCNETTASSTDDSESDCHSNCNETTASSTDDSDCQSNCNETTASSTDESDCQSNCNETTASSTADSDSSDSESTISESSSGSESDSTDSDSTLTPKSPPPKTFTTYLPESALKGIKVPKKISPVTLFNDGPELIKGNIYLSSTEGQGMRLMRYNGAFFVPLDSKDLDQMEKTAVANAKENASENSELAASESDSDEVVSVQPDESSNETMME